MSRSLEFKKSSLLFVSLMAILLVAQIAAQIAAQVFAQSAVSDECDDLRSESIVFSGYQMKYEPGQTKRITVSDYDEYMLYTAISLLNQGHDDKAIAWLRKAAINGNLTARANLANVLALTGQFREALSHQKDLLQDCDSPLLKLNYIAVLVQLERFDEALSALTELETEDTTTAAYSLTFKGQILTDLKRYPEAVIAFQKAHEKADALSSPDRLINEANLGIALYLTEQYHKALAHLRRVAFMDSPQVKACLGASLLFTNQYEEALGPLREAESSILLAKSALGISLFKLGRFDEALRPLTEASEQGDVNASWFLSTLKKIRATDLKE